MPTPLATLCLLIPATSVPQDPDAHLDPTLLRRAAARFAKEVAVDEVRGGVLLVAQGGRVLLHEAHGWRDVDSEKPMRTDSQFRMASNTKPLTATAIMMLVEAGKLELDATVGRYLPAWRHPRSKAITLRQLLTHTSGLRIPTLFLRPLMKPSKAHPGAPSLQLEADRFAAVGPAVKPGTSYSYSNPGYNTLAAVVEKVSGMPFARFLRQRVYQRLGMVDSGHRESAADPQRMSVVFRRQGKSWRPGWRPGDGDGLPFVRGSGGMVSTAADYLRLCQCFLAGGVWQGQRLLRAESVRAMTRAQLGGVRMAGPNSTRSYGLGWVIEDGSGVYGHNGSDGTYAWVDPVQQLVCLVFTQSQRGRVGAVARRFFHDVRRAVRPKQRPNVLLITADDLNRSSVGAYGCTVPGITPNIDRLAAQGIRFAHGHVNIAVCQPSRAVMLTGRYPHSNGARGFEPIAAGVPTLSAVLKRHGYRTGIFGKTRHVKPDAAFAWDVSVPRRQLGEGRSPQRYAAAARAFFKGHGQSGQPFFLMANCHDPHRPFAGSAQERRQARRQKRVFPKALRTYRPEEIQLPGFLPDLPRIRKEIAEYYSSVHRCDAVVGALLAELQTAGLAGNTLVLFLSDNGMALPFAKTNCYLHSTATPWILRWPARVKAGQVDRRHMVSAVDWLPTVLEAASLPPVPGVQGRSFLPLLKGERQAGRDQVLTSFYQTSARKAYPMRALLTRSHGYIVNAWADGETAFRNESMSGLSFRAMQAGAAEDAAVAARVKLFRFRCPEELFDLRKDPDALHNLIAEAAAQTLRAELRRRMGQMLRRIGDPEAARFVPD